MFNLSDSALYALKWSLDQQKELSEELKTSISLRIGTIGGLKTFPVVAQKVLNLLGKEDYTIDEITDAIRQDPSLAAGVIKLANSPFYTSKHSITSLDMAFIRLGRNVVRDAVWAVVTMQLFPDKNGWGKYIRDHCAATAALAHCLSKNLKIGSPEVLFLAGLLHDIGILLFMDTQEVDYNFDSDNKSEEYLIEQEEKQAGFNHAILGGQVLHYWKIGLPIPQLVSFHHLPQEALVAPSIKELLCVLKLAEFLEVRLDISKTPQNETLKIISNIESAEEIKLDALKLSSLWDELTEAKKASLVLFGG